MQETRQHILEILRDHGEATVKEIVDHLCQRRGESITAVTVRHHLNVLQEENLITIPQMRHKSQPGRPQHIYVLTEQARAHFPNNYQKLALGMYRRISDTYGSEGVNVILQGVADDMAQEAAIPQTGLKERLNAVVSYLTDHGYDAAWEQVENGFLLHTYNCPYHDISKHDDTICTLDMRLISRMLGVIPRLQSHMADGDGSCSYFIHDRQ